MPTEFTVGVRTECSDGYCGQLSRVATDPATRKITHLVIKPEHRLGPTYLSRSRWST